MLKWGTHQSTELDPCACIIRTGGLAKVVFGMQLIYNVEAILLQYFEQIVNTHMWSNT